MTVKGASIEHYGRSNVVRSIWGLNLVLSLVLSDTVSVGMTSWRGRRTQVRESLGAKETKGRGLMWIDLSRWFQHANNSIVARTA